MARSGRRRAGEFVTSGYRKDAILSDLEPGDWTERRQPGAKGDYAKPAIRWLRTASGDLACFEPDGDRWVQYI